MHRKPGGWVALSARSITLAYVIAAVIWIGLSDRVLGVITRDPGILVAISTLKGWLFVAVTGAMLAVMLRRYERQRDRQSGELELRERRFRLFAEHAQDIFSRYRLGPPPSFEYVSPSVEAVLGYPPEAYYADAALMTSHIHPDDRAALLPDEHGTIRAEPIVLRVRHADGHWVSLEQRSISVRDGAGRLIAVEGVARDVSERVRAEAAIDRLNRVLRTLSAANSALVRATHEAELFESICRVIVEEGAYRAAWVGYLEADAPGTLQPVASAGYGDHAELIVGGTGQAGAESSGPIEAAMRENRTVIVRDIASDPAFARSSEAAIALGCVTGAVIPLRDGDAPFGAQLIYSTEPGAFEDEEVALLEELAADLSYGVGALRSRAARAAADADRTRLATAIEQTAESVVVTDPAANIVYVNPAFERVTGYAAADVLGRNPRFLQGGVQSAAVYAGLWSTLTAGRTWTGELINRRRDGTLFVEEATISPVVDGRGALTSYVAVKRDVTHLRALETSLEGASRQHAEIAATLAHLQVGETAEATAQAIADALLGLDGLDSPTVLAFDPTGTAIVLGRGGGRSGPVEVGGSLPRYRSMALLERARVGAWGERWVPGPHDGEYGARFAATGLQATIYAPMVGEQGPIGLLAVGTTDPERAERLADHLPALVEFAGSARLLLEQQLEARWERARARRRIESIIGERAFRPVFQPLVDLGRGIPIGYEALTRFEGGARPDLVFAEARRCGLGQALEAVTLRAAIHAAEELPIGPFLSLNVSPDLILDGSELRAILAERTRPIVLELTEHDAIADYGAVRSAFVALGSGLRLAVDDAGAGIANFNHLVELRPQFVKIDIGLVRGVNADLTRQALIVALLHFARATECHVIAEGIETAAERAVLEKLELEFGQGYLFGHPAEASAWARSATASIPMHPRRALRSISGGRSSRS